MSDLYYIFVIPGAILLWIIYCLVKARKDKHKAPPKPHPLDSTIEKLEKKLKKIKER